MTSTQMARTTDFLLSLSSTTLSKIYRQLGIDYVKLTDEREKSIMKWYINIISAIATKRGIRKATEQEMIQLFAGR